MIKGKRREVGQSLTIEAVYQRLSPYDIYRYYIGSDFKLGKPFKSPFRLDKTPSFTIDKLNCGLHHQDWSDMRFRGDAIDLVQQLYNYSLPEALAEIDQTFGLGIKTGEQYPIRKAPVYKVPRIEEKRVSHIQFTGNQKFERAYEAKYWNDYHFSFDILRRENVYCVRSLYIDRVKFPLPKGEPVFAYYEPGIQKVKIMRPYANKEKKEWKWRSTIPFTFQHGLENLQFTEKAVIAKSNKDRLALLHYMEGVTAVQGESFAAISPEALEKIKGLSNEQFVFFGSDPQGVKECASITSQLGLKYVNTPKPLLEEGINDPAEWVKGHGHLPLYTYLKEKGIITYKQLPQLLKTA